jgi:hypothetical protein
MVERYLPASRAFLAKVLAYHEERRCARKHPETLGALLETWKREIEKWSTWLQRSYSKSERRLPPTASMRG